MTAIFKSETDHHMCPWCFESNATKESMSIRRINFECNILVFFSFLSYIGPNSCTTCLKFNSDCCDLDGNSAITRAMIKSAFCLLHQVRWKGNHQVATTFECPSCHHSAYHHRLDPAKTLLPQGCLILALKIWTPVAGLCFRVAHGGKDNTKLSF